MEERERRRRESKREVWRALVAPTLCSALSLSCRIRVAMVQRAGGRSAPSCTRAVARVHVGGQSSGSTSWRKTYSRSAFRSENMDKPSINQVTKHEEIPQIYDIDKGVVDVPVVMQRQVPQIQIQTVWKTVEVTPAQFVGRVVETPVIMQVRQRRMSRRRSASRSVHRSSILSGRGP